MPGNPGDPVAGGGGGTTRPEATTTWQSAGAGIVQRAGALIVTREDGTVLPNVQCLSIHEEEFAPWSARFAYQFGNRLALNTQYDPRRIEQVFPLTAKGPRVVKLDDRLRVYRRVGDTLKLIFDGFAQAPQVDVSGNDESCLITALAAPIREWDTPITGAIMRDNDGLYKAPAADKADPLKAQDVDTDEPTRFNPDGKPNCTPKAFNSVIKSPGQVVPAEFPVFVDETASATFTDANIRLWDVGNAARYICRVGNPEQKYVTFADIDDWPDLLQAVVPTGTSINWADKNSYKLVPIPVQDLDITGDSWPDALRRLIEPHGFAFRWTLSIKPNDGTPEWKPNTPQWKIDIYRKDDNKRLKNHILPKAGTPLRPGPMKPNLAAASLVRDTSGIINAFQAATSQTWYEISVILAPAFEVNSSNIEKTYLYVRGADTSTSDVRFDPAMFRRFIFGEGGDAYWDYSTGLVDLKMIAPTDLTSIFFPDSDATDFRQYVRRRRKTSGHMISRSDLGDPLPSRLEVSINYSGKAPGIWDPKAKPLYPGATIGGDWQLFSSGGWDPLKDQIGIEFTYADPRSMPIKPGVQITNAAFPQGSMDITACVCAGIASSAPLFGAASRPYFRLTTKIQGDHWLENAFENRRKASPTKFPIKRLDDTRDRFEKKIITKFSAVNVAKASPNGAIDKIDTDDSDEAADHCKSRQRAHESGTIAGHSTVPYYFESIEIGDKLTGIVGRNISLALNANLEKGESPTYPVVVSRDRVFQPSPSTTISWGDNRSLDVPPETRRRERV